MAWAIARSRFSFSQLALHARPNRAYGAASLGVGTASDVTLLGTPLSHFTRKVRLLLLELGVPHTFSRISSLLLTSSAVYGDNPLLRAPTLLHRVERGHLHTVVESDHIARYVLARWPPQRRDAPRFSVLTDAAATSAKGVRALNQLAVCNGVMANEVVLLMSTRGQGGLTPPQQHEIEYYRKLNTAIESALAWMDEQVRGDGDGANVSEFTYVDMALVSMFQHLAHYNLVWDLSARFPSLAMRVDSFSARPSVVATTPAASLKEAHDAGWRPA